MNLSCFLWSKYWAKFVIKTSHFKVYSRLPSYKFKNKILWLDSQNRLWAQFFWGKVPFWANSFFWAYSQLLILFTHGSLSFRKTSEKSLTWIPRTSCMRFLIQLGIKMSYFGGQKEFFWNIHYCHLCLFIV